MGNKQVPCDRISIDFTTKRLGIFYSTTVEFSDFSNLKDVRNKVDNFHSYKELTLYCIRNDMLKHYTTNQEIFEVFVTKCNIDNLILRTYNFTNQDLLTLTRSLSTITRIDTLNINAYNVIISNSDEFGMNLVNFLTLIFQIISTDAVKNFTFKTHIDTINYDSIARHLLNLDDEMIVSIGRQKIKPQIYVLTCEYMQNVKHNANKFMIDLS